MGGTEDWELVALGLRDELLEEKGTIWPLPHPPDREHRDIDVSPLGGRVSLGRSCLMRKEGMI